MLIANAPIVVPISTANTATEVAHNETVKKVPIPEAKSTVENPANRQAADSYQDNKNTDIKETEREKSKSSLSEKNQENTESSQEEERQELAEQKQVQTLRKRDREVRAHEQAHAAVGGELAGAPQYQYTVGPDGKRYAVAGEVSIDIGPEQDPKETIAKMEKVRRAALAPVEPSSQDLKVAAQATQLANQALTELSLQKKQEAELKQVESKNLKNDLKSNDLENQSEESKPLSDEQASRLSNRIINSGALGVSSESSFLSINI